MKNAQVIRLRCDTSVVVVPGEFDHGAVITVNSMNSESLAKGIARMINEEQCVVCGKFNGLHGEVFYPTSSDNGEVRGTYRICPHQEAA